MLLPGIKDPALGFLGASTWLDLRRGIDDATAIEAFVRELRGEPPGPGSAPTPDPAQSICPYRGLLPFREEDAEFFVGRETFTETLAEVVASKRLVAVVGPSGSGKSSVVRAGLVPLLRKGAGGLTWEVLTLTPGAQPLQALTALLSPPPAELSRTKRLEFDRGRREKAPGERCRPAPLCRGHSG